ncbi:ABC-type multidrug transport system, ATPase and permease component [Schinkia azotoformans MEV2011]|uniref:ABC-type multidrug transport system, ATPase and permease component n=1 Tax=Schinkia azotoformans MEV2011 TaxID=1348973 RepID=A0A072NLF7_SCHAZ|nr:ABC transporter ATP-binding protein [Schinkia azotoformans]KEF38514.1 ABC-type multidrug transport system, ATPase and permease component [Schinkia azotoformans MEV2011]MEC1695123.1 ABC transporter ATP-binding protein [Schinkia azotoformans]MEC1723818.1 ABC transporter ATP-binding protein [Schinkia azotoformans]MEC1742369.1 ABC transporter ATP-binding protein [Schinkia azotoformans]MEC1766217.1 ABC transporter ATP-binding protein [Schinkia azotoformans]
MLKIFKYFQKKDWLLAFCSLVFIVTQVGLDLKIPDFMAEITRLVQTEGSKISAVLIQGVYMLLCAIGSMLASMVTVFLAARVAAGFSVRLRDMVFEKNLSFSMEEVSRFSTASLITRSTNDIMQIQMLIIMGLQVVIRAPIMAVWAIFKIMGKSWEWTAATGIAIAFLCVLIVIVVFVALPKFRMIQTLTDQLNRVTRENLSGMRVVRAYNAEKYEEEKFESANNDLTRTNLFTSRTMAILFPSIGLMISGMNLAIYWIGAVLINDASMPNRLSMFADMVVFSSYAMQIIMAFMMLSMVFIMMPRAAISAKRINEVLDTNVKIKDGIVTKAEKLDSSGKVEFCNVSFKYPEAEDYVLRNVSFSAHQGETIAIIGSTGSGKSTLLNLIPRFMDATEGEVLVDGIDVKEYSLEALRNKIGYVSQKAIMFSGSVASNVAFGEDTKKASTQIERAVEIAQGKDFVEKMEGMYEAEIAQSGTNISGGQKQRLSIARAIFKNPEIYLFDDSFSALDYKTDRVLRSRLKKEIKNATSIIVAQRIGTIIDADRIIVLDEGEVVGIGTHQELLRTCEVYQEIAYSQLSKEELEIG